MVFSAIVDRHCHGCEHVNDGATARKALVGSEAYGARSWLPPRRCRRSALRAHPHMPRRRKSISPLRASGGSASPSTAARSVSYCATTLDRCVGELLGSASTLSRSFFSTDGALDRPRMHIEAELLLDQFRQLARPDWLARNKLRLRNASTSPWILCGPRGPRFLGTSPAMPASSKFALAW